VEKTPADSLSPRFLFALLQSGPAAVGAIASTLTDGPFQFYPRGHASGRRGTIWKKITAAQNRLPSGGDPFRSAGMQNFVLP
jgi:hypothetical protein